MQETGSCTGAHFAFGLPEFDLGPHALLQIGSFNTCKSRCLRDGGQSSTTASSGPHFGLKLSPQTCQRFLSRSVVGHDEPTPVPLLRLRLQTRKLSLDGFVDQRPLLFCIVFHLHIFSEEIHEVIHQSFQSGIKSHVEIRTERGRTSIETSLSLFLKS